jgi:hypothetical protein
MNDRNRITYGVPGTPRLFLDFLASGHQTAQDGIGEALADTAVASMALQYSPY